MTPVKRTKRSPKAKKAPAKRRSTQRTPQVQPQDKGQGQWDSGPVDGEIAHEKLDHPWPETEKEPVGEGAKDQQKGW